MNNRLSIFLIVFLFLAAVVGFMLKLPRIFRPYDKELHSLFYFGALLLFSFFIRQNKHSFFQHAAVFCGLLLFGVAIEWLQEFSNTLVGRRIHGRFDRQDIKANALGLLAASGVFSVYKLFYRQAKR